MINLLNGNWNCIDRNLNVTCFRSDFPDFSNFYETLKTAKEIAMRNLLAFFTNFSLLQRGICNSYFNMHYIRHKYALGMVDDVPSEQHYREKKG